MGEALVEAVAGLEFPAGRVHAFVHGEAGFVKELRRLLRVERGIPREDLSISGYWRLGHNEDGWQASKREWNAQVEAEQEARAAACRRPGSRPLRVPKPSARCRPQLSGSVPPSSVRVSDRLLVRPERADRQPHRQRPPGPAGAAAAEHRRPQSGSGRIAAGPPPAPS